MTQSMSARPYVVAKSAKDKAALERFMQMKPSERMRVITGMAGVRLPREGKTHNIAPSITDLLALELRLIEKLDEQPKPPEGDLSQIGVEQVMKRLDDIELLLAGGVSIGGAIDEQQATQNNGGDAELAELKKHSYF